MASVLGNGAYVLLAVAAIALLAAIASCATTTSPALEAGATATSTAVDGDWIPLLSQAPVDILAAARSGPLFQQAQAGGGDGAPDLSRLGSPVLVQGLRSAGESAGDVPDFYVIPILNAAGATTDAVELALNPAHTAVQETAIITYAEPRAGGSIAHVPQDQAIQVVTSQRHVAVASTGHLYLVYFLLNPQQPTSTSQDGQAVWTGGGALPADPLWLVPATDGGSYLAGNDGRVYSVSELPR